jgi:hypothetical protein
MSISAWLMDKVDSGPFLLIKAIGKAYAKSLKTNESYKMRNTESQRGSVTLTKGYHNAYEIRTSSKILHEKKKIVERCFEALRNKTAAIFDRRKINPIFFSSILFQSPQVSVACYLSCYSALIYF